MEYFNKVFKPVVFVFFFFFITASAFAGVGEHLPPAHWGYEGKIGPDHWGAICKCKIGENQSPIDISTTEKVKLSDIIFHYHPTPLRIINNGHTLQVNYEKGSSISIDHKKYELLQFHFHTPSEHVVHGKHYDMEAHLVHRGEHGELAVIAVLIKKGHDNTFINTLWRNFPKDIDKEHIVSKVKICASQLLPNNTGAYYTYAGSLTTPPCSENVDWIILKTPIEVTKVEVDKFVSIFKMDARPIQPLHGRIVKERE